MGTVQPPSIRLPDATYKRSLKNYIVDSRFQLKYTGLILAATIAIAGFLGVFVWRTSGEVVLESQRVVEQSRKVSDVVRMSIKDDPVYGDNPVLAAEFTKASNEQDSKIQAQQDGLVRQQHTMLITIVGALAIMVFVVGILGIYFTHKVAGPIYKMKLLLKQVADGKLRLSDKLRKGDELQDFFDVFARMVDNLRARKVAEVALMEKAIVEVKEKGSSDEVVAVLTRVRDHLKSPLDA